MDSIQIQGIEQYNDIFREKLDRVRARSGRGLAVTSRIVAKDAEPFAKFGSLRVPHRIIRAERIREHQHRRSTLTFQRVMNPRFSRLKDGHRGYSSSGRISPKLAGSR